MQLHTVIRALINARKRYCGRVDASDAPDAARLFMPGWVPQRSWSQGWRDDGLMCGGGLWGYTRV